MATTAGIIAAVGAAAAVGGTAASVHSSRKAQRAQEKADQVGNRQAEIANQRAIRQNLIRSRTQQARLITQGQAQTGSFTGSSSVAGALGSARTQQAANVGFAQQTQAAGAAVNRQMGRARGFGADAAMFGAVANLPGQFGFDLRSVFEGE